MSRAEFTECWSGCLLILVPEPSPTPTVAGSASLSPWRRFVSLLGCHKPIFVEAFFCALLMTLLGISTAYFVQHLVDSVLVRSETRLLNALAQA